jgi:hypothetical protein
MTLSNVQEQAVIDLPDLETSLQGFNMSNIDISIGEDLGAADVFDLPNSTDDMGDILMDLVPLHMDEPIAHGYHGAHDIDTITMSPPANKAVPVWPYATIQPRMGHAAQAPWSVWTTSVGNHDTFHTPELDNALSISNRGCLMLLQPSSRVVQHNIRLLVQALRAYPLMMLRRETLPPFIHPHWNLESNESLPQVLSNCMSVAQMYAFRNAETKPFIWRTVKAEDEWFLTQVTDLCSRMVPMLIPVQRKTFSSADILAAIQALIIYMIMRFVDGASEPIELNQQLVRTYQVSRSLSANGP